MRYVCKCIPKQMRLQTLPGNVLTERRVSEVVRQRVPGHRTGDGERPTAERAATMSYVVRRDGGGWKSEVADDWQHPTWGDSSLWGTGEPCLGDTGEPVRVEIGDGFGLGLYLTVEGFGLVSRRRFASGESRPTGTFWLLLRLTGSQRMFGGAAEGRRRRRVRRVHRLSNPGRAGAVRGVEREQTAQWDPGVGVQQVERRADSDRAARLGWRLSTLCWALHWRQRCRYVYI